MTQEYVEFLWENVPIEIINCIASFLNIRGLGFFAQSSKQNAAIALHALKKKQQLDIKITFEITGSATFCYSSHALYTCGNNRHGQLGLKDLQASNVLTEVVFDYDIGYIKKVIPTLNQTVLLTDESIYVTGVNTFGQFGLGDTQNRETFTPVPFEQSRGAIKDVIANINHTLLLCDSGLFACGKNVHGELGLGDYQNRNIFTKVPLDGNIENIKEIILAAQHTFLLTDKGLYACGLNEFGQLGLGNSRNRNVFTRVLLPQEADAVNIKKVIAGPHHTFLLTDGGLYACGWNKFGQLGLGNNQDQSTFAHVLLKEDLGCIKGVIAALNHTIISTDNGLYVCGRNSSKPQRLPDHQTFTRIIFPQDPGDIMGISAGKYFSDVRLLTKKGLYKYDNENDPTALKLLFTFEDIGQIKEIILGRRHTFVFTDRAFYSCGSNSSGQLGLGDYNAYATFAPLENIPVEVQMYLQNYKLESYINFLENFLSEIATESAAPVSGLGELKFI